MAKSKSEELVKKIESLEKENSELKSLLESRNQKAVTSAEFKIDDRKILLQINDFSLKLAYLPAKELFPFITSQIKSIFNVRAALINTYNENTSELVLQYTTLSDEENSKVVKVFGSKLLKHSTFVNEKEYKRITSNIYEQITSLHELTFGAIPDIMGKAIEKLFGVDWFAALGLVHDEKLVGTMILAGDKNQPFPEREIVSAFSGIIANALIRKEAEERSGDSEKRFQSIVNSSPMGMHIYNLSDDDKLVFVGANPASDRILGFDHKGIIGLTLEEAFPSLIETEIPAKYKEVVKNNTTWKTEQLNYKDEKITGAFEIFAFRSSESQLIVRFNEITDRVKREHALKESEEKLSITLNSIGDGVIATDRLGNVINMNPVAEEMCGWKLEQAKGKPLDEIFHIADSTTKMKLSNPVEKVINTGRIVELSNHTVLISKDGKKRNISDSAAPILDKENNIQGVVLVFSDVTEKYKARESIISSELRATKQRNALTKLATSKTINEGNVDKAKQLLTEIAAETLNVERCSLWLMSKNNSEMHCIDLFESTKDQHSEGALIKFEQCPTYFREVTENSPLAVSDVLSDKRTIELSDSYLVPLGIVSMLDSRVTSEDGGFGGVICFEHIGTKRIWHPDEESFATTIASYLVHVITLAKKKEVEEALQKNEEKFRLLIELAPDAFLRVDKDGSLIGVNDKAIKMFKYSKEELLSMNIVDLFPHIELESKPLRYDLLDAGETVKREREIKRKNDEILSVEMVSCAMPDGTYQTFIRDITERVNAEKEKAHLIDLMKFVIENTKSSVSVFDTEMNYIYVSNRYYDDMHLSDKNIIGRNHYDVFPDLPQFLRDIHKRSLNGEILSGDNDALVHSDGSFDLANWTCMPWYKADNSIGGVLIYVEVITERMKAANALKESEEKFRALAENVPGVIYLCKNDELWSMIYLNDAVKILTGYSKEEFLSNQISFADLYHPEDKEYVYNEIETAIKNNRPFQIEYRIFDKNKSCRWVEERGVRLIYENKFEYIEGFLSDITDRKKTEEDLERFKIQLIETIMQSPLPMVLATAEDFKLKVINKATEDFLLIKAEDYLEKSLMEIDVVWQEYSPEGMKIEPFELPLPRALSGMVTKSKEMKLKRRDGTIVWQLASGAPIFDSQNELIAGLLVMQDITDRKLAEEALKKSEAEFRNLFDSANDAILIFEPDSEIILEVNNKACEIYGFTKEELVGMSLKSLTIDVEKGEKQIEQTVNIGQYGNFETQQLNKNGDTIHFLLNASAIDYKGKRAILSINRDVTDRKHSEKALKESEELYRKLLTTVPDLIIRTDLRGNITFINESVFPTLSFVPKETMLGKNILTFISREDLPRAVENTRLMFERPLGIKEYKLKFEEGTILDVEINGDVIYDANNNPMGMVYVVRNITERKNMEIEKQRMIEALVIAKEKAEEMNRVKSIFFANMSHELRTPFVGITGFAELLAESLEDSEAKYMAEGILKSSARMQDTLSKILGLAKLESDSVEVLKRIVNVNELILDLFESFRGGALLKNIAFENEINFNELIIESDDFIIKDILQNLISNAIKCTNSGGVKIIAEVKKNNNLDFLIISVADTGVGIPKEKLEVIWEPFRQASEGFNRDIEGSGLGLSIVKRSSELLDGILNVISEEGKGSIFTVSLPIKIISGSVEVGIQNTELVNPIAFNKKILYVEDDELSREVVKRFLFKTSEIEAVSNASEALEKVKSNRYDAILMDINLKESKSGVELTQEIRKITNYERIPIVAITAYASQDDKVKFLSQGFTHYISKPFKKLELIELINSIFTEYS